MVPDSSFFVELNCLLINGFDRKTALALLKVSAKAAARFNGERKLHSPVLWRRRDLNRMVDDGSSHGQLSERGLW